MTAPNHQLCELCQSNPASAIKSHIFSHFFLRSLINPPGQTKRGIGRSFGIGGEGGITAHVERDISRADFEELFGSVLSDVQYEELQMDQFAKANLLCSQCENKVKIVEDYFNDNVYRNVDTVTTVDSINKIDISKPGKDNRIIRLFFYTLLWRASVAKHTNFAFPKPIENQFRELLDSVLGSTIEETTKNAEEYQVQILSYPLIIATCKTFTNPGANQVFIDNCPNPYYYEINEYIIWYYPDVARIVNDCDLLGLSKYAHPSVINLNEAVGDITFVLLPEEDWMIPINTLHERAAKKFFKEVNEKYFSTFRANKKRNPTLPEYTKFREKIVSDGIAMGIQWTKRRIDDLITKNTR